MTSLTDSLAPIAINNAGQIFGIRVQFYDMFLYSNDIVTPIDLPGASISAARDISAQGDMIGTGYLGVNSLGFLYSNGQFTPILPGAGVSSDVRAINDMGQIVGMYTTRSELPNARMFLYSRGESRDLGPLFAFNLPLAINNATVIVGYSYGGPTDPYTPWIYRPETGFSLLNDEIAPTSGWSLQEARDINDSGQIVGYGHFQGNQHGFLLTPIPEPSTIALFGLALLGLAAWSCRYRRA